MNGGKGGGSAGGTRGRYRGRDGQGALIAQLNIIIIIIKGIQDVNSICRRGAGATLVLEVPMPCGRSRWGGGVSTRSGEEGRDADGAVGYYTN